MKRLTLFFISFFIFIFVLYFFLYFYNQKIVFQQPIYIMDKNKYPLSQYDKEFVFKVGNVHNANSRKNYFLTFSKEKKEEMIRIGAFGDSFTYGAEVEKGWSYPYQLQKLFDKYLPEKKIKVLNFGMEGHGFQQHFLVWKEYAKKYNIDYILFGPEGSQPNRDITMINPWASRHSLSPPRGRYILRQDGLDFINIKGNTFFERYKNYYTLYPSWKVLRYDKLFLDLWRRVYFPNLDVVKNPFYYSDLSDKEEAITINRILLRDIKAEHFRKILFLSSNKEVYNLYKTEQDFLNLNYLSLVPQTPLYYRIYHHSTLGNEVVAKAFFKVLQGKTEFSIKIFQCLSKKQDLLDKKIDKIKPLKEIFLSYRDLKIAKLENLDFRISSSQFEKSFITFFNSSESFINSIFYSVPLNLDEENKVFIKTDNENLFLGSIFPLDEKKVFFGFQKNYISTSFSSHTFGFPYSSYLNLNKDQIQKLNSMEKEMSLYIDDYKIADLKLVDKKEGFNIYRILLSDQKSFYFSGQLKDSIRHKDLPEKINLSFKYIDIKNKIIDSSVLGFPCIKKSKTFHVELPNFDFIE